MTGTASEPSTYHWIMTVRRGGEEATAQGTRPVQPGETREQAFLSIHDYVQREMGVSNAVVVFFALEPNHLR